MSPIPHIPSSVNQTEREILMHQLRTAAQRTRLETAVLENIIAAVRHRQIGPEQAREWLREENLSSRIEPKVRS